MERKYFKRPHRVVKTGKYYVVEGPEAIGSLEQVKHRTEGEANDEKLYMDYDWQVKYYGHGDPVLNRKIMKNLSYGIGGFSWWEVCGPDGDAGHKG